MYLEISARQSGKTTRLIKSLFRNYLAGKQCIVFGCSYGMTKELKRMFMEKQAQYNIPSYGNSIEPQFFTGIEAFENWCFGRNPDDLVALQYYYDEFDFYKCNLIISDNGYYCGTAKKLRTITDFENHILGVTYDPLIQLLTENNFGVVSHQYPITTLSEIQLIETFKKQFSKNTFDLEMNGMWKKY